MDPVAIAGMVFTLVLVLMIGGFILLFPVSRRLGQVLEKWLEDRRPGAAPPELAQVRAALESMRRELQSLRDRQDFVEQLLRQEESAALPPGDRPAESDRQGRLPGV